MDVESILVTVAGGPQLHVKRICADKRAPGAPVLMFHGLVEDGRIYYSQQGRGLAFYLASAGYDVYVADFRGKGKSWPLASPKMRAGLSEAVNEDMPALIRAVVKRRGSEPQIWVSHGIGGVISSAYFARYGDALAPVSHAVYFGTRRTIVDAGNGLARIQKKLVLNLFWRRLLGVFVRISGYLPARALKLGTMNESARTYRDTIRWMFTAQWHDSGDGFDYGRAAIACTMPPSLYFASEADTVFACPLDVRQFIGDLGGHDGRLVVLNGNGSSKRQYGHVGMLADPDAEQDHFPELLAWLQRRSAPYAPPKVSAEAEIADSIDDANDTARQAPDTPRQRAFDEDELVI